MPEASQTKASPPRENEDAKKLVIEIWKVTIGAQQHFNDLELRIRNYAVTMLVAVLGATGLALKEGFETHIAGRRMPLAPMFVAAGLVGWITFYLMDRLWYHRLLYGAVKHADNIEKRWREILPEIALTGEISARSPIEISRFTSKVAIVVVSGVLVSIPLWLARYLNSLPLTYYWMLLLSAICVVLAWTLIYRWIPRKEKEPTSRKGNVPAVWLIHSTMKMNIFYGAVGALLVFLVWATAVANKTPVTAPKP